MKSEDVEPLERLLAGFESRVIERLVDELDRRLPVTRKLLGSAILLAERRASLNVAEQCSLRTVSFVKDAGDIEHPPAQREPPPPEMDGMEVRTTSPALLRPVGSACEEVQNAGGSSQSPSRHCGATKFRTVSVQPGSAGGHVWANKPAETLVEREEALNSAEMEDKPRESLARLSILQLQTEGDRARLKARRALKSRYFDVFIMLVITLNIIVIGWQADWSVKNPHDEPPTFSRAFDFTFNVVFTIEFLVRIFADGFTFLYSSFEAYKWNRLDGGLVVLAWFEEIIKVIIVGDAPGIAALRMLRIFRFVRVVRVVRVARFFHDLRVMVWGVANSMKSLGWAVMLLFILSFMFAVLILESVSGKLSEPEDGQEVFLRTLRSTWTSLIATQYILFQAISGGVDWGLQVQSLVQISPMFGVACSAYIAMAVFCVLNIITGVFVENAKSMLSKDETTVIMQTIEARKQWLDEVKALWRSFSKSENLDYETFSERLQDVRIQALFRRLGVEVASENVAGLFNLLDLRSVGTVNVDEFAMGIEMLHGYAKNIDMARLRAAVSNINTQLVEMKALLVDMVPEENQKWRQDIESDSLTAAPTSRSSAGIQEDDWSPRDVRSRLPGAVGYLLG